MTVLALRSENGAESAMIPRVSMGELLGKADFLSLHCPLTETNTGLVDESFLAKMKPSAFLINTARGGLIQTDALLHALDQGVIQGAAIDVLTKEPASPDATPCKAKAQPDCDPPQRMGRKRIESTTH